MRTRLVGGVDEAGRGCLLGPLVVAGVSVDASGMRKLKRLGVRDSKKLTPGRRAALCPEILEAAEMVRWEMIHPREIDETVASGRRLRKLNYLEAVYFARVIDGLGAQRVTVDASDVIPGRFAGDVIDNLGRKCSVVAYHKADRDYPVVSAASIVAKVKRDAAVAELRDKHGDFGSGYPSDPVTKAFFADLVAKKGRLPDYVRKSWKTWARYPELGQTKLTEAAAARP
ncbi:MAG: ribonuclease HII [Nitrososphaerota archaeon]|jgi:ribonuclease HII|nr:ribonuclease HII [Nitrososphaerota archaeon]MDG6913384.1 ribonuclease HII [Nitrososphaerota archaeon]MDG6937632.1 ribonuclease HII [Nitrososphaerota archaeon]MDG6962042.1 ribonuclease HII [Nitrososphaerota archaeon]MDG6970600.1 ribonuclease HII [Nitrososphaerota archaeon]